MKLRVPKSRLCDTIQCRRWNDAAEGTRRAVAAFVGHDEQHVGRAFWRHDGGRPSRFRLRGFFLDHTAELRVGRGKLFAVNRGGSAGRAKLASDLLSLGGCGAGREDGYQPTPEERFGRFHWC